MGGLSPIHLLVLAIVAILLLGGGRFSNLMGDVAKGVKNFKKGMAEEDHDSAKPAPRIESRIEAQTAARPAPAPVYDPASDRDADRVGDGDALPSAARQFRSGFDQMVREAELEEMEKKWKAENERIMREHPAEPHALEDGAAVAVEQPVIVDHPHVESGVAPSPARDGAAS